MRNSRNLFKLASRKKLPSYVKGNTEYILLNPSNNPNVGKQSCGSPCRIKIKRGWIPGFRRTVGKIVVPCTKVQGAGCKCGSTDLSC